ncbi:hypothetical protein C8Q80DRAFT_802964 [Daedaleopsis nitida]|nr:hypothetical protein C8Q80DRAFT_802964 [Daedaleopsis nitida]
MQTAVYLPSSPTTPHALNYASPPSCSHPHSPLRSSPLASPTSSPAANASARRRLQYKANAFSSPVSLRAADKYANSPRQRRRPSAALFVEGSSSSGRSNSRPEKSATAAAGAPTEEPPRNALLRERLKARCIERAQRKRERAIARGSRHLSSEPSSDGMEDMMDEDSEDEESMLNDELFRRIVESAKRKERHGYRLSYALEVGSSFDPEIDDTEDWGEELLGNTVSTEPQDLLDEELEAYAAEAELNLDDLPVEDIFSLSDFEDGGPSAMDEDVDMD